MPFYYSKSGGLKTFVFESFPQQEVVHGIFTRHGGVSPSPWSSLNLGGTVGDSRENIIENRLRIFSYVDRPVDSIYDSWQVHGDKVKCVYHPRPLNQEHEKADAIVTDQKDITLFMRFADCVPVLLYDPVKRVTALVHAGWQGTVKKIAARAVEKMISHYGSHAEDILAGIGPSIGPDHYEVGMDVIERVIEAFGEDPQSLLYKQNGSNYLNLWRANELTLQECGVKQIELAAICTACHTEDWFSHRAERGKTGRFAALIALR